MITRSRVPAGHPRCRETPVLIWHERSLQYKRVKIRPNQPTTPRANLRVMVGCYWFFVFYYRGGLWRIYAHFPCETGFVVVATAADRALETETTVL